MLSKWRQHNPVLFLLLFQARNGSRLNLAMQAGQVNWLQIKLGCGGLPGSQGCLCWVVLGWKVAAGHLQVHGQLKQQPGRDTGHAPAGVSLQPGASLWAALLKLELTCSRASQEVLFWALHLGLRKCSISCTFKIVLGWCLL